MEEMQTGVEVVVEAAQQSTDTGAQIETSGEQVGSEAGAKKGDPETAWGKRITSMRQKWEQETAQKYGDYEQLKSTAAQVKYMEKQAKIYGYDSVEEYTKALDEYERQQEIQKEAEKYGVPEDFIRGELKPLKDELEQLKQERVQLQQKESERQLTSELERVKSANPDFDTYFDAIADLYKQGYSLEHAYRLASYEDKLSKIGQEKEQEVLAKVTARDEKQVLSSSDKPNNLAFTPSNMSFKEIEDISKRVQAGEKIKF